MLVTMNPLKLFLFIMTASLLYSCSPNTPYWANTYVKYNPARPDYILVSHNLNNGWEEQENGQNYFVSMETWESSKGETMYRLSFSGTNFDHVYFSGFWNYSLNEEGVLVENPEKEMQMNDFEDWTGQSFIYEGRLKESEEYTISLSIKN